MKFWPFRSREEKTQDEPVKLNVWRIRVIRVTYTGFHGMYIRVDLIFHRMESWIPDGIQERSAFLVLNDNGGAANLQPGDEATIYWESNQKWIIDRTIIGCRIHTLGDLELTEEEWKRFR